MHPSPCLRLKPRGQHPKNVGHRVSHRVSLTALLLLVTILQGCAGRVRSIQSLKRLDAYPKMVTVKGRVGDRIPLVNQYVYELEDESGTIWVQTGNVPPNVQPNLQVKVKGQLQRYPMPELGSGYGELFIQELSHEVIDQ